MLKLLSSIHKNSPDIYYHGERVGKVAQLFLEYAGIKKEIIEKAVLAAKIHDIGKAMIPIHILKKEKEGIQLSEEEEKIWKKHSEYGVIVLNKYYKNIYDDEIIISAILSHHERYDGEGFPNKIKKYTNYQTTYVISMIDQIDNLVRKKKNTIEEAIQKIDENYGNVDPYWISMFKRFIKDKDNRTKVEKILIE